MCGSVEQTQRDRQATQRYHAVYTSIRTAHISINTEQENRTTEKQQARNTRKRSPRFFFCCSLFFLTGKVALQRVNRFEASGGGSAEVDSAPSSEAQCEKRVADSGS